MKAHRLAILGLLVAVPLSSQEVRSRLAGRVPSASLPALDSIMAEVLVIDPESHTIPSWPRPTPKGSRSNH